MISKVSLLQAKLEVLIQIPSDNNKVRFIMNDEIEIKEQGKRFL